MLKILVLMTTVLFSFNTAGDNIKPQNNPYFDIKTSSKKLGNIISQSNKTEHDPYKLSKNIIELEELYDVADQCINKAKEKLEEIDKVFKNGLIIHDTSSPDHQYIMNKKKKYSKYLSECRYFNFRANEILAIKKDRLHQLTTHELLKRSTPIWQVMRHWSSINLSKSSLLNTSGFNQIGYIEALTYLLLLSFIFFISRRLISHYRHLFDKSKLSAINHRVLEMLYIFLPYIVPTSILSVLLFIRFYNDSPAPTINYLSYSLLIYLLVLSSLFFLFHRIPGKTKVNFFKIPTYFNVTIHRRLVILSSYILIGYFSYYLLREQSVSVSLGELLRSVYIILLSVAMFWSVWPVLDLPNIQNRKVMANVIKLVFIALLVVIVALECIGLHQLVVYFTHNFIVSIAVSLVAWAIFSSLHGLFGKLATKKTGYSKYAHKQLGVKSSRKIIEINLIEFSIYIVFTYLLLYYFSVIWQVPTRLIDAFEKSIFDGFELSGMTIIPVRLITGLLIFSFINLFGRFIATKIAKTHHFEGETDTQVAIASIFSYLGFSIALIIALMVSGFNFTGLAIIVGALSVGIGLGLQNIVNNFISGIILLLEKPIKPGDRIIVGETEGFVNKIRVRSTQIRTMAKEDVIVPNSDLITNQVTNFMFRDRQWRVSAQVGVAYGSNTELVRKVLLDVAMDNPDVINDETNPPVVLFRTFGESSLNFELWCVITDVNKKYHISSELNFAIDKAFRENDITIAFPQRDIHIKRGE